jgi:hypothetical protein
VELVIALELAFELALELELEHISWIIRTHKRK